MRFVSLVENETHVLFGTHLGGVKTVEAALAKEVLASLVKGMLCLAARYFYGIEMWNQAGLTGADLLWRIKKNIRLACEKRLSDGSCLSRIYASQKDQRKKQNGIIGGVIKYKLEGASGSEPIYCLLTTILDHEEATAAELAALYHEH